MKTFKVVNYKFGIISNLNIDDFIELVLKDEPQYDLFQVIDYSFWALGQGITNVRYLILKLK